MTFTSREAVTQRIRDAVNIVDVVSRYVNLRPAGANLKGLCPFHQDKTPSFLVHPAKQIFKCFGCGAGGDVFKFIQLRENVDFNQARALLAERAGIPLEVEHGGSDGGPGKGDIARVNRWALSVFRRQLLGMNGAAARAYQERRGITARISEAFALGFALDNYEGLLRAGKQAGHSEALLAAAGLIRPSQRGGYYDTFRNRLMFPIIDTTDRLIGFGGRALGDDPAKYLNTPETRLFDKGRSLFGLNRAREAITRMNRAIVVEGYMDCVMAHQFGFEETVAALGTAFTDDQAQLLRRFTDCVILVFDSDEAGQKAADRALSVTLLQNLDVRLARVPTGKDPCDFLLSDGADAFASLLNGATPALQFKWQQVVSRYREVSSAPARRRVIEEYLEQIAVWVNAGAVDVIQRGLILNQIAKLLSLPSAEVYGRLGAIQKRLSRLRVAPALAETPEAAALRRTEARQTALRHIVEVLINEPRYVGQVGDVFERESIEDPVLSRIAREVLAWCRQEPEDGQWRLDVLLSRFEDVRFGQWVTDLRSAGLKRGNYRLTIEGALECIRRADRVEKAARAAQAAPEARRQADREAENRALAALTEGARRHRHFSPMSRMPRPA